MADRNQIFERAPRKTSKKDPSGVVKKMIPWGLNFFKKT
jgi:hypothetical protein